MDTLQDSTQLVQPLPDPTAANKTKALHRNKACLNCRTRKTKCDASKPICSSCLRLGPRFHSQCQYDQPPKWLESVVKNNKLVRHDEQNKIIELELKLQRLHHRLIHLQNSHPPNLLAHHHFSSPSPSTTSSLPDLPASSPPPILQPTQSSSTDSFLLVSEPNWLSHLPPRQTCKTLIKAFFNRPLSPFTLVEPVGLQSRIDLSCNDPNFPEAALIHAICAIGSQYLAVQDLFPPYWSPISSPPHLHHARWAERLLNNGILSYHHQRFDPLKLIQLSEAAVLCCQYYTLVGKPLMIWKSLGYSIRLATLLGLNYPAPHYPNNQAHLLPGNSKLDNDLVSLWPDGVGSLEDPPNPANQHYRTILWWYVFCCDKMCAAAGGFASTIDEKDSLIPIYNPPPMPTCSPTSLMGGKELNLMMSSAHIFTNSIPDPNSLYHPKSPGFFFCHQVGDFDSLQLLIKAAILLGRVNTSLYRRSHPAKSSAQINQEYKELSNLVWGLFNSIPEGLKNPFRLNQSGHLDSCLLSAHTLIHTALIQMNEDLVEINPKQEEEEEHLKICKQSGKVLIEWFLELIKWKDLGLIQVDLGHLLCGNPALNFALSVALRTHCRFIAICKLAPSSLPFKNHSLLDHLVFQINFILSHLKKSQKMPLEGRVVELINSLLDSPWTLLPKNKSTTIITNSHSYNYLNNDINPNKKTKFSSSSCHLNPCKSSNDFHSMVSNFALAKLLDSQI